MELVVPEQCVGCPVVNRAFAHIEGHEREIEAETELAFSEVLDVAGQHIAEAAASGSSILEGMTPETIASELRIAAGQSIETKEAHIDKLRAHIENIFSSCNHGTFELTGSPDNRRVYTTKVCTSPNVSSSMDELVTVNRTKY